MSPLTVPMLCALIVLVIVLPSPYFMIPWGGAIAVALLWLGDVHVQRRRR